QPIERAEGETERKHRKADKRGLAHPDREARITVLVLAHGKPAQSERCRGKKAEEQDRAAKKETPIEISALGIQRRLVPGRNVHPWIKMVPKEKDWHEKKCQDQQQCRKIFQLTPHHHRPFGVGGMMDDCPTKAASAQGEEKCKSKKPRITQLMWIDECADSTEHQRHQGDQSQHEREPRKAAAF